MLVRDVMTTELVTVDAGATLRAAVRELLDQGVGSVVVVDDDGIPLGLVTETDVLRAACESDEPLGELSVRPLVQGSLATTGPDRTVEHLADRMIEEDLKKLPVVEDLELVGIVTLTDVVYHLSEFRADARRLAERHDEWRQD